MPTPDTRRIVVSADGSAGALNAVAWAASEAALRRVPLRIVHAFAWPMLNVPPVLWQVGPEGGLQAHAGHVLAEAEKVARSVGATIEISTAVVTDLPLPMLLEESKQATYVVVGPSSLGSFAEATGGAPMIELPARAQAPVVVVHGEQRLDPTGGLVIVGFDGSPPSAAALEVAAAEANTRDSRLLVVSVERSSLLRRLRRFVAEVPMNRSSVIRDLQRLRGRYPDLRIEERRLTGHVGGALVSLSDQASLIVVGNRGRGGFTSMLLGSTSHALIHHARCPVIVVPHIGGPSEQQSDPRRS